MKGLGYEKFTNSTVGVIAFGALSGGIGAELSGGNFWQGVVTGGIVAGLNHAMHKLGNGDGKNPPKKKVSSRKKIVQSVEVLDIGNGVKSEAFGLIKNKNTSKIVKNYMKGLKVGGYVSASIITIDSGYDAYKYYEQGGKDWRVRGKYMLDTFMTGVGFLGPKGFAISTLYFVVDKQTNGFGLNNK